MTGWVRTTMAEPLPPPTSEIGPAHWLRVNLFATPVDTALTIAAIAFLAWALPPLASWLLLDAQWTGSDRSVCATVAQGGLQPDGWAGACWAFVGSKWQQFLTGRYPLDERWRVIVVAVLFVALLAPLLVPKAPAKAWNAAAFFVALPVVAYFLLAGGAGIPFAGFGLVAWIGNGLLTVLAAVVYLVAAIPLLLFTALGAALSLFGLALPAGPGEALAAFAAGVASPFAWLSDFVATLRDNAEHVLGGRPSFWIDYVASAAALTALASLGGARRALSTAAAALVLAVLIAACGLDAGLPPVETPLWGGLMVTLVLSFVGIAVSLPLGIVLALGRRSRLPVIRIASVTFIETVRGVPLVTVLFMASVMLPLFLPPGTAFDKLLRAVIGVALFASAYMAEVVRGGLQAIPKGQYEAADALGLTYAQKMIFIVLPQALKLVIPGIVNSFIGLFKDTSLVYIIGMFDLLGVVRQNFSDPSWATVQTPATGLVFAAFVFWVFCFAMSRYSQFVERRLDTGHKR